MRKMCSFIVCKPSARRFSSIQILYSVAVGMSRYKLYWCGKMYFLHTSLRIRNTRHNAFFVHINITERIHKIHILCVYIYIKCSCDNSWAFCILLWPTYIIYIIHITEIDMLLLIHIYVYTYIGMYI